MNKAVIKERRRPTRPARKVAPRIRPDLIDPTRGTQAVKVHMRTVNRRMDRLMEKLKQLVETEDAFGLAPVDNPYGLSSVTLNKRWEFKTSPEKLEEFARWLRDQIGVDVTSLTDEQLWRLFVEEGYRRGAGRAFDDTKRADGGADSDLMGLTREEFLRTSFGSPVAVEKVKLLVARVFTELKGVTEQMAQNMTRTLADGLVTGSGPKAIVKKLAADLDTTRARAETIARTEFTRVHAEGQLDALETMGVAEVGAAVEWTTAANPCAACAPLKGVVMTTREARGLIPRHPRCRCAWVPNLGESGRGIKRTKLAVEGALKASAKASGDDDWNKGISVSENRPDTGVLNMENLQVTAPTPWVPMTDPDPASSLAVDRFARCCQMVLNANPRGCNQYTGPGCAVGQSSNRTALSPSTRRELERLEGAVAPGATIPAQHLPSGSIAGVHIRDLIQHGFVEAVPGGGYRRTQEGGPGPLPTTYGGIRAGHRYVSAHDGEVRVVSRVENLPNGQVKLHFEGRTTLQTYTTSATEPFRGRPVGSTPAASPAATSPPVPRPRPAPPPPPPPPTLARPQPAPPPPLDQPREGARPAPATTPAAATGGHPAHAHDLSSAEGLVGYLKAQGGFTELTLGKIAALNPNGLVGGKFVAPTIPVGSENRTQLDKLSRALPPGTVIKGKYVTKANVTPEHLALVAGARARLVAGAATGAAAAAAPAHSLSDPPKLPQNLTGTVSDPGNVMTQMFGRQMTHAELGAMANAFDGARVSASVYNGYGGPQLQVNTSGHGYHATRTFRVEADGIKVHNDIFEVYKTGAGPTARNVNPDLPPGADILANQVKALSAAGVVSIDILAAGSASSARSGGFVGYKVWPKLGYDGKIDRHYINDMPEDMKRHMGSSRSILDLYAYGPKDAEGKTAGEKWWAEHGRGMNMEFDVRPGSRSRQVLEEYLNNRRSRASRTGQSGGTPPSRSTS